MIPKLDLENAACAEELITDTFRLNHARTHDKDHLHNFEVASGIRRAFKRGNPF